LKRKLLMVLSNAQPNVKKADEIDLDEPLAPSTPKAQVVSKPVAQKAPPKDVDFDDDEESLSYFSKLANED